MAKKSYSGGATAPPESTGDLPAAGLKAQYQKSALRRKKRQAKGRPNPFGKKALT